MPDCLHPILPALITGTAFFNFHALPRDFSVYFEPPNLAEKPGSSNKTRKHADYSEVFLLQTSDLIIPLNYNPLATALVALRPENCIYLFY